MSLSKAKLPEAFSGIVRLFPLPDLVLFPGVVQALHMFEPRYRKLTQDVLAADQLIALCLYQNAGKSLEKSHLPPIHEVVCIAKIIAHHELEDGRFNLLVAGLKRARIERELPVEQPYRMAEVQLLEDSIANEQPNGKTIRDQLVASCTTLDLFEKLSPHVDLKKVIESQLEVGLLIDLICFSAVLDCVQRQSILELNDIEQRFQRLVDVLTLQFNSSKTANFPPDFSDN